MNHHKARNFQSDAHRARALLSERRAEEASDAATGREWREIAIEWHLLATTAANREMS